MCGILAIRNGPAVHHRQLASLRRRGPDAIGYWVSPDISISHARLSIIGLDERGTQPLENERHVISFNGEIYNFEDIRARLGACKVRVTGSTDTEVLLHAWTKWGPEILPRLSGFWAFVVYDKQERTLTMVRDQLGIKPLYYWHSLERTVVSSLLRTIVEAAGETPLMAAMAQRPEDFEQFLVHTGQHYDDAMSDVFFRELGLPAPDVNLEVGSGSHAQQTAQVMMRFEPALLEFKPGWVIVPGDVNSTLAMRAGGCQVGNAGGASRGGAAVIRPKHARGNQSCANGPYFGRAPDAFCGWRSESAAGGGRPGEDSSGGKHHDRFVDEAPSARKGARDSRA
jgi:hypothetical protein